MMNALPEKTGTFAGFDGVKIFYHEIFNELGGQRKQVLKDLEGWLERRIIP